MSEKDGSVQDQEGGRNRLCICPNCGYEKKTPPEVPCFAQKCRRCGAPMADI